MIDRTSFLILAGARTAIVILAIVCISALASLLFAANKPVLAANDTICTPSGSFAKAAVGLSDEPQLTADQQERSSRAMAWLESMTGTTTKTTSNSTIELDQEYDSNHTGAVSGSFTLYEDTFSELSSIRVNSPDNLDGSYRGVVSGVVTESIASENWIIQAYKRESGVTRQIPVQTLSSSETGSFSIDLSGVSETETGEWVFGLLENKFPYAPYGTSWPDAVYENLEVQQYVITDTAYYWSSIPARVDGTFRFDNSNIGRKLVRLVDTSVQPNRILAEYVKGTGLIRSYAYAPGETGYGTAMEDRSFVYDQATALFAAIGTNHEALAKKLANGLLLLQTTSGEHEGGFVFAAPQLSPTTTEKMYRTGAHAIATDALLAYIERYPDDPNKKQLTEAAIKALSFIESTRSSEGSTSNLYLGGYGLYSGNPQTFDPNFTITWASTEHNIDIWHTYMRASRVLGEAKYAQMAADLNVAITTKLLTKSESRLNQGISPAGLDTADPLDVNSWGAIQVAASGNSGLAKAMLDRTALFKHERRGINGYAPFYDSPGYPGAVNTVWYEGSFGVALAYYRLGDFQSYSTLLSSLATGQEQDGSFKYATDEDTQHEIGTSKSVAGTAWYVLTTTARNTIWNTCVMQSPDSTSTLPSANQPSPPNTGADLARSSYTLALLTLLALITVSRGLGLLKKK